MDNRTPKEILHEANVQRMRLAFILTPLTLEMEAVLAHLKFIGWATGQHGEIYECGVFSDPSSIWLVVVFESGPGNLAAQSAVKNAIVEFGKCEVLIVVGIGGSRKSNVPIGSVVASDRLHWIYGGKYKDGRFLIRPRSISVKRQLVNIAKKVCREKSWQSRIHCNNDGMLSTTNPKPVDMPTLALVAPMGSVEAVLADPNSDLAAHIDDNYDDSCVVEMEGYGAVHAANEEQVPSIVVRGVSDMTENKEPETDEIFQPIAASRAAAFAFEVLSIWCQAVPIKRVVTPETMPIPSTTKSGPIEFVAKSTESELGGATKAIIRPGLTNARETFTEESHNPAVVLNLDVEFSVDIDALISALEAILRDIVNSDQVTVIKVKSVSSHFIIADPLGNLRNTNLKALRTALAERGQPRLLGMIDITEYEDLDTARTQLGPASTELMTWPNSLPDGEVIHRPELTQLIERIDGSSTSTTTVLGPPGAGKSALLATVANRYAEVGWPVLAIKGDLLNKEISTEENLQTHLGLDAPPSDLLKQLAEFQPVLLVLDQLDALAGYLDLRTARLSILLNLVRRLGGEENIHIVLSSRIFEFEHDVRLRAVSAQPLSLELPTWNQVQKLLEDRGINAAGWPVDAQEVMRTPQALAIYLKLNGRHGPQAFTSYQDMLDELWHERVLREDGGNRLVELIDKIADLMASEESLWVARARFDECLDAIDTLEAADVLITSNGSLGFKHQTLFEYALARSFARHSGQLTRYVLKRQTSLFFRSKLWAGLSYLRKVDINAYHKEIEEIWNEPDLRKHLRFLLIDFLGKEMSPTDREALLVAQALQLPEQRWQAYRAIAGSQGWFVRFHCSFIANCMNESDKAADAMIYVLARAWTFAEESILSLLKEHWMPRKCQDSRSWRVIYSAPSWSDAILEVACTIAQRSDIEQHTIDHVVETIGVKQPVTALYFVRACLDRDLSVAIGSSEKLSETEKPEADNFAALIDWQRNKDPRSVLNRLVDHRNGWETLPALAKNIPEEFLEILWSWYEKLFNEMRKRTVDQSGTLGFVKGPYFRFKEEDDNRSEPNLLSSLRIAVENLPKTNPDAWLNWANNVVKLDMEPVQSLIAHCFACHPANFSRHAFNFLLEDSRRFILGKGSDITCTSARLIKQSSEYWTEGEIEKIAEAVRAFRPSTPSHLTDAKNRFEWTKYVRRIKLSLLQALPNNRLTGKIIQHVEQERRIFPDLRLGIQRSTAQFIGPIMDSSKIARASDMDVVNAFRVLPDTSGWNHPRNWRVGGNVQLSQAFANFAKENPDRAIRLIGSLDPENGTRATARTIEAMSDNVEPDKVLQLFKDVVNRGFDSEEFRVSLSWGIVKLVNRGVTIDDDVVSILVSWLTDPFTADRNNDDINTVVETASAEWKDEEDGIHNSLLWADGGGSSLPGGDYPILEALIQIHLKREEFNTIDEMLHSYLDRNKEPKHWKNLLHFVQFLHPEDGLRRAVLLEQLFMEVPSLIQTREAARILACDHWWNADFVDSQLNRWENSNIRASRQAYGEIVAVVALLQPTLEWAQGRLNNIVRDRAMVDARTGVALTAANLWSEVNKRADAGAILTRLLTTGEAGVWKATFELFRLTDSLSPDTPTVSLLTAIADNIETAPRLEFNFVAGRLGTLLPHEANLVGRLAEGLIEGYVKELGDIRTRNTTTTTHLVDLAVTLHRLGPETRDIGTAMFERLIEVDAWEARKTIDEIDNRFLDE